MAAQVKLLQEWMPIRYDRHLIQEDAQKNGGKILLRGVLQKSDTLNQNGRIYPRAILEREVENYQKLIAERRSIGELDHPSTSVVELKNGSHLVTEAKLDGDVVYGTIEVLHHLPMGRILRGYIDHGITIGISSRGVGSTQQEGAHQVVNNDFQLICWDVVAEPSTPGAFMMNEGQVIFDKAGRIISNPPIEQVRRLINRDARVLSATNDFLGRL